MKVCVNGETEFATITSEQKELILKCLRSQVYENIATLELYENYFKKSEICVECYESVKCDVENENKDLNEIIKRLQ